MMPHHETSRQSTVLIVDDQPVNIQSMSKLLAEDYHIQIATSGAKALDIAAGKNPPDLILLDILMPEMDGYEVCRRLKANERTRRIPVIFVTAMDATEDEEKGLSLGAVDYISKPFQPSIVRARVRNQTERKQAEEALRRSEEKFRLLIENSHDIIYTVTSDGIFRFVSPSWTALLGHPVNEVEGRSFQHFVHPDDLTACLALLQKTIETAQRQTGVEYRVRHADGSWRFHNSNAVPLKDESGTVIAFEASASDITERKRVEDALMQANKKLNLLNSITRHDILNQITALGMLLQMLEETVPDDTARGFVAKSQEVTERITQQIEFTSEYQNIGVKSPQWQNVHEHFAASKNLLTACPFDISIETGNLEIYADPLLGKVFYNLLENAVRHGEKVTRVRFFPCESETGLTLIYEDNGVGIDAASKKNLFKRGFGKHTGFGLFMIREILAITGILIEETGEPGKGARFEIFVPKGSYRRSCSA